METIADLKKAARGMNGEEPRKKRISKYAKEGLQLPIARVCRYLKKGWYAKRVGATALVYLAAVLESMVAEVIEWAGNEAKDTNRVRIIPRHIQLAVTKDGELAKLLANVTIADGGVFPHINLMLLSKRTARKTIKKPNALGKAEKPKSPQKAKKSKSVSGVFPSTNK